METRRDLLKKGAYAVPAILTLKAVPSFAANGSARAAKKNNGDSDSDSDSDSEKKAR